MTFKFFEIHQNLSGVKVLTFALSDLAIFCRGLSFYNLVLPNKGTEWTFRSIVTKIDCCRLETAKATLRVSRCRSLIFPCLAKAPRRWAVTLCKIQSLDITQLCYMECIKRCQNLYNKFTAFNNPLCLHFNKQTDAAKYANDEMLWLRLRFVPPTVTFLLLLLSLNH